MRSDSNAARATALRPVLQESMEIAVIDIHQSQTLDDAASVAGCDQGEQLDPPEQRRAGDRAPAVADLEGAQQRQVGDRHWRRAQHLGEGGLNLKPSGRVSMPSEAAPHSDGMTVENPACMTDIPRACTR